MVGHIGAVNNCDWAAAEEPQSGSSPESARAGCCCEEEGSSRCGRGGDCGRGYRRALRTGCVVGGVLGGVGETGLAVLVGVGTRVDQHSLQ